MNNNDYDKAIENLSDDEMTSAQEKCKKHTEVVNKYEDCLSQYGDLPLNYIEIIADAPDAPEAPKVTYEAFVPSNPNYAEINSEPHEYAQLLSPDEKKNLNKTPAPGVKLEGTTDQSFFI